jgi:hypothetical protein
VLGDFLSKLSNGRARPTRSDDFQPQWTIKEANNACFIVRVVYCEDEPGRRTVAKRDAERRIAINIAKLPELLIR